ncbi:hypothetical protein [Microbispora sp. ATCC PTA-5024]|uniref:hypothetical protein n=1 Tax=Microbispora sp. ATCC PTA-5024 TaxID=316330 RepID=UPI0003DD3D35|nr:hypothetical protein [Microbispora sp. ATCC PTA-5024]ETK36096.1 hypothetical protein MPTA5024_10755 [Microbispora sp. ATCC PTA-5024]
MSQIHLAPRADEPETERPEHARLTRAERRARDAEAQARRAEVLAEARLRREERAQEWKRRRKAARTVDRAAWWETTRDRADRLRRALVLVAAIVGVNLVAVAGQVNAFHEGLGWPLPGALGAAAVVESIAIYVGWHAHVALIEGDSVFRLRAASYGIAALVAGLNYHHYATDWHPTDKAIMFGLASLLSPWLWAMHSRYVHRKQLRAAGLIDPRAPKFSMLRWLLHRAETWQALRWAVRHSEQSPAVAILAVQMDTTTTEAARLLDRTRDRLVSAQGALIRAQSDALTVTELRIAELAAVSGEVSAQPTVECPTETPAITPAPATDPATGDAPSGDQDGDRDRPDEQDNRDAEKWIRAAMRKGRTPTYSEVNDKFGFSRGWAGLRVQAARDELAAKGYVFLPRNIVKPPTASATTDAVPMTTTEVS